MIHSAQDALLDGAERVLVDSNVIIAFFDQRHKFHAQTHQRLTPVYLGGADFYYVQPCLLEFKEYWRRKKLTECIELRIKEGYYLYRKFKKAFNDFSEDNARRQHLYLSDRQLKDLRATLENVAAGKGVRYWLELCQQALVGTMSSLEASLAQTRFKYARFNDDDVFPLAKREEWPNWKDADVIQEKFGLAASDAAILNMTNGGSNIDALISNDGDMLFAVANGALRAPIDIYTFLDTSFYV